MNDRLAKRTTRLRMSPAMAIALVALLCALGGTSIAASKVLLAPRNSVNSVAVIDHTLLSKDFKAGQLPQAAPGERGAQGPAGTTGPAGLAGLAGAPGRDGSAKAFAYVDAHGSLDPARSLNITSINLAGTGGEGFVCFNLPFKPKNTVASIQSQEDNPFAIPHPGFIFTGTGSFPGCGDTNNAWVVTESASGNITGLPFYVMFN